MTLGVSILAHERLDRVAQLAGALARAGAAVVVHVDSAVPDTAIAPLHRALEGTDVLLCPRIRCEWGRFSLVQAQLGAAQMLLAARPDVTHLCQISGACLPTRPLEELRAHLRANPDTDFIESVTVGAGNWIKDGLEAERFSLYFPFSWKRQRRLFDRFVTLQRRLGIRRRMPPGLEPHIGSQWWVLTRQTLSAILNDPARAAYDRFFARTWIPDESYFQTLARKHARRIESRSLTLCVFDRQGKPVTFYDDHLDDLQQTDAYFARKIWPGADRLYRRLLDMDRAAPRNIPTRRAEFAARISAAEQRQRQGRRGLHMVGRDPDLGRPPAIQTARPYWVFEGLLPLFPCFNDWLADQTGVQAHGHLFAPDGAQFAGGIALGPGCLPAHPRIRDENPEAFLTNLVWNSREGPVAFHFDSAVAPRVARVLAQDDNARIVHVRSAWCVALMAEQITNQILLRARASEHLAIERQRLRQLSQGRAQALVVPLGQVLANPAGLLGLVLGSLDTPRPGPLPLPQMGWPSGLMDFMQMLRNIGVNLSYQPDIDPAATALAPPDSRYGIGPA